MSTTAFSIHAGMTVYATDGQKLGTVGNIFSGQPSRDTNEGPYSNVGSGSPSAPASTDWSGTDSGATGGGTLEAGAGIDDTGPTQPVPYLASTDSNPGPGTQGTGDIAYENAVGGEALTGGDAGIGSGAMLTPSDTKYFEVHSGGILGIGGTTYYVPFDAVDAVAAGTDVTLSCTQEECAQRYSEKPAEL